MAPYSIIIRKFVCVYQLIRTYILYVLCTYVLHMYTAKSLNICKTDLIYVMIYFTIVFRHFIFLKELENLMKFLFEEYQF